VLKLATFLSSYTYCHLMVPLHWIPINKWIYWTANCVIYT
jgi:hypothetical protein